MTENPQLRSGPHDRKSRLEALAGDASDWLLVAYLALLPVFHLRPWSLLATGCLLGAAGLAAAVAASRRAVVVPDSTVLAFFLIWVALSALSVFVSDEPVTSAHELFRVPAKSLLVLLVIACRPSDEARLRRVAEGLAAGAVAMTSICFALYAIGARNPWGGITGPEVQYSAVCMFLIATVPFVYALAEEASRLRVVWTCAGAAATAAILLTFSRLGWAAFAAAVTVWLVMSTTGRVRLALTLGVAAVVAAVATPDPAVILRVTDTPRLLGEAHPRFDRSALKPISWHDILTLDDRLEYGWKPAVAIAAAHPVLGAGFGPETFARRNRGGTLVLYHEHNAILSVAVQSGLPAAAAFCGLLAALMVALTRAARRGSARSASERRLVLATLTGVLAAYVLNGLGEPANNGRMGILLGALTGLAAVLCPRKPPPERPGTRGIRGWRG